MKSNQFGWKLYSIAIPTAMYGMLVLLVSAKGITTEGGPETSHSASFSAEAATDVHASLIAEHGLYPSAATCANCHENIYDEWRSSAHAYSGISPMFHKFEQALNELAVGTVASFCVRCHLPVGTAVGQPRHMSIYERATDKERFPKGDPYVSVEGVTCIACHRVGEQYGRVNGQRRIEPGTIFEPMYGSGDGGEIDNLKGTGTVALSEEESRSNQDAIEGHSSVHQVDYMAKSEFCMSCHQVAVHPGIKLEVVWDQYLNSPSHNVDGVSCQECHMGKEPGLPNGYEKAPRATILGAQTLGEVDHKDHAFVGPGYSIAHPGIFPHRKVRSEFPLEVMVTFDWRQPWGITDFENAIAEGTPLSEEQIEAWFDKGPDGEVALEPSLLRRLREGGMMTAEETSAFFGTWTDRKDRETARGIVDENRATLDSRKVRRKQVMENASHMDGPFFDSPLVTNRDLKFHISVENICRGHNLPSGSLGAQPQLWLNVALTDPDGEVVWESGYLDSTGDLADLHSQEVLDGKIPHDDQLFNLQTKFLTTNVKGTDREMYLPVNFDVDQIPFIRPAGVPSTVLNHPPFIRMEQHSLPPLKKRDAHYTVPGSRITKPGTYTLAYRLRSRAEPIYFMNFVKSTTDMMREMNSKMVDVHATAFTFEIR